MILVDTSIWVAHLRSSEPVLVALLEECRVMVHPFVVGELAMGNLKNRAVLLDALGQLARAKVATDAEVLGFVEAERLHGRGIGYVDAHLLASARLSGCQLWSQDQRLSDAADALGASFVPKT